MPLVFTAIDEEFAAATGGNVGVTPTTSTFDNPPNAFKDLVITVNDGDPDPRHFELGDSYDLSWGGFGGGGTINDAVVVRSDMAPGGGGVIVFQGIDDQGDVTQIIWTPGFNLEEWYSQNYNPSAEPQFYTSDTNAAYSHEFMCFADETRIATAMGQVPAGELWEGDLVSTLDGGPARVEQIVRRTVLGRGAAAPVMFAPGTIGNHAPLRLSQQHNVMLSSPLAELLFGARDVLVPAKALIDGAAIRLRPCAVITYVHLLMEHHQIVLAEGAPCETLFAGEMALGVLDLEVLRPGLGKMVAARPMLRFSEARVLVEAMRADRTGAEPLAVSA